MDISFWLIIIGLIFLVPTGYAGLIGAPYAPTKIIPVRKAFQLLHLDKEDTVIDLGVGDGKILLEAARHGAKAIGYELSPIMFIVAWLRFFGNKNIALRYGNFFKQPIDEATIIFVFLMPKHMEQLRRFVAKRRGPKLQYVISYAFAIKSATPLNVIKEPKCAPLYIYEAQSL